ncbi:MAG: hypothetical protein P4L10_12355 [Acidobacteriaceae bacterium]|nr:hypothetical protein [Acidobacteriaceae bacterium]
MGSVQDVQLVGLYSAAQVAQLGSHTPQIPLEVIRPLVQIQAAQESWAVGSLHTVHVVLLVQLRQAAPQLSQVRVNVLKKVFGGHAHDPTVPLPVRVMPGWQVRQLSGERATLHLRQVWSQAAQNPLAEKLNAALLHTQVDPVRWALVVSLQDMHALGLAGAVQVAHEGSHSSHIPVVAFIENADVGQVQVVPVRLAMGSLQDRHTVGLVVLQVPHSGAQAMHAPTASIEYPRGQTQAVVTVGTAMELTQAEQLVALTLQFVQEKSHAVQFKPSQKVAEGQVQLPSTGVRLGEVQVRQAVEFSGLEQVAQVESQGRQVPLEAIRRGGSQRQEPSDWRVAPGPQLPQTIPPVEFRVQVRHETGQSGHTPGHSGARPEVQLQNPFVCIVIFVGQRQ